MKNALIKSVCGVRGFEMMNKIDRQWYRSLRFLSKRSVDETFGKFSKKNPKKFKKYTEGETWDTLHKFGHVTSMSGASQIVTPSGLEQLRILEDIRRKNLTLIASVVAVIISLFALAKSFGLF